METTVNNRAADWEIAPTNTVASIVLAVLFLYLFFRHFLFILMFMDVILGWLRQFSWFPKEGKRRKTFFHWLAAVGMFSGFLVIAGSAGWLEFIPR